MVEVIMCVYSRPHRLGIIRKQLEEQTSKCFSFTIRDNTKDNQGAAARFAAAKKTKGNPIIFIDDDQSMRKDFVEYMVGQYDQDCVKGFYSRIFDKEGYWDSVYCPEAGTEVDYVGTGGMVLDRRIFDEEPSLLAIPPKFFRVEDLFLCYLARKRGLRLYSTEKHIACIEDGKNQLRNLRAYKETAFAELRRMGWPLLKDKSPLTKDRTI